MNFLYVTMRSCCYLWFCLSMDTQVHVCSFTLFPSIPPYSPLPYFPNLFSLINHASTALPATNPILTPNAALVACP